MIDVVNKLLAPIKTRVANMVARAVVKLVDDEAKLQVVQLGVLAGETREGCERFQQFGFTSVPLEGAEAVVLFVGGNRDHPLVLAVEDRRYRMKAMQPGEAAIYNSSGHFVLLKSDRAVVTAPEIRLGSDSATNFVALANLVLAQLNDIRTKFDTHTHPVPGVTPGPGATTSSVPAVPMGAASSVAAAKVKAE